MKRLLIALALLGPAAAAAAQQLPPVLTLDEALRIARERNPDYRKVQNDLEVAEARTRQSWGAFLPSLSTSLNFSGSSSTRVTGQGDFEEPVRLPDPITFNSSSANQAISAGVTLFDGGRNLRALRVSRSNETSVEATIRAQLATLTLDVTREFFDAVKARRLVEIEEQNLASARERLERTEAQFRIASTNQVEVLGATRNVVTAERLLLEVRANAAKARHQLAQRIGLEPGQPFEPSSELPPVFDPTGLDEDAIVVRALASNPGVRQREAALVTARNQATAARGARWPQISASVNLGRSTSQSGYGAFGELNPLNRSLGFGLSATLPIFSRFQTSYQIAEADAGREDAEEDLRRARLEVEQRARNALIDLRTAHRALQLATDNARISAEQLELAEEMYRVGSYDFLQLQQLIDANQTAQRDAVDAQFTFITARATLEEVLGAPLEP